MGISKVHKYIEEIKDELCGAKKYAEKYILYMNSKPRWSSMFNEMSKQELKHAEYWKDMGEEFYNELAWKSEEDIECWEKCMACYAETVGVVKMMLSV